MRRVVVTGMGCISPAGNNVKETWSALLEGKSGAGWITHFDASRHKTRFAAEVKGFDAAALFGPRDARKMDRFTQFATAATMTGGMTFKRKYITVKGLSFGGSVRFDRLSSSPGQCAQFDSLAYSNIYHSLGMDQAKDCMVYKCNVTSGLGRFTVSTPATPVADWTTPERDTIRRCTFHLGEQVTDGVHIVQIRGATKCVIDSNQVYIQMAPNLVNEIDPFIAFYMRNCEFKDNRWQVINSGGNHLFRWRDSTQFSPKAGRNGRSKIISRRTRRVTPPRGGSRSWSWNSHGNAPMCTCVFPLRPSSK